MTRSMVKNSMLPVAMIVGALGYQWIGKLTFLSPWLIFAMLFITYCKLDFREIKPTRRHWLLLGVQMSLAALVYFLLLPINHTLAEGVFICVFIPTATAAPVITRMLGGSISFVATYSLLVNTVVACIGAVVLAAVGDYAVMGFWESTLMILKKVFPLLILPLLAAMLLKLISPKLHDKIARAQQLSFYLWAIALLLIVGSCVGFVILHWDENQLPLLAMIVVGALAICLLQFIIGRRLGARFTRTDSALLTRTDSARGVTNQESDHNMSVSVAQSLMQKNTVLAVWLAMAYMTPLASVGPAAYIAWQNIINSWQLMRHTERRSAA